VEPGPWEESYKVQEGLLDRSPRAFRVGRQNGPALLTFCSHCSPQEDAPESAELLRTAAQQLAEAGFFDPEGIIDANTTWITDPIKRTSFMSG
jgi:hypothetical protein